MQMKVYGFFYTDCIWENGGSMKSLHLTKKGAYLAMRKFLIQQYNEWYTILGKRHRINKPPFYDQNMEIWYISEIEVLE